MGLSEIAPDQVTAEALRPLIARGLISACGGVLTLVEGRRRPPTIRVAVPSEAVRFEQIRVHLETRSAALADHLPGGAALRPGGLRRAG